MWPAHFHFNFRIRFGRSVVSLITSFLFLWVFLIPNRLLSNLHCHVSVFSCWNQNVIIHKWIINKNEKRKKLGFGEDWGFQFSSFYLFSSFLSFFWLTRLFLYRLLFFFPFPHSFFPCTLSLSLFSLFSLLCYLYRSPFYYLFSFSFVLMYA